MNYESDDEVFEQEAPKHKGMLLAPDDLEVDKWCAVHSLKENEQMMPFFGVAFQIKAIQLPFVVVLPVGSHGTTVIDTRTMNLMNVSKEYVEAQRPPKQPELPVDGRGLVELLAKMERQAKGDE